MTTPANNLRLCPTRADGTSVLFAHKVSTSQCQERQRGRYHKCFTCAYNNAYVAVNGLPVQVASSEESDSKVKVG